MKFFIHFSSISALVLFCSTFALAQNPNCPDASEILDLSPIATDTDAIATINGTGLTLGGELLQVAIAFTGGATQDEDAINDDQLTGCTGLQLGVTGSTNGINTSMTTTYTLSAPVANICFTLVDIDRNDEIIVNASSGGVPCSIDAGDAAFTLLDQSSNSCIDYLGNNLFSSNCVPPEPNLNDTTRGAIEICFNKPIDQLELTFYDMGATTGGSYTLCNFSTCVNALPIELAFFNVIEDDCRADLVWRTVTESNFSRFEVEKSTDGVYYTTIVTINPQGNGSIGADYDFADEQLAASNYYRLKMIDNDGFVEYSDIKIVTTDCSSGVSISGVFPNPVRNTTSSVRFISSIDDVDATMVITDVLSRVVTQQTINVAEGQNFINLDVSTFNSGIYYLFLEGNNWQTSTVKFVKQ